MIPKISNIRRSQEKMGYQNTRRNLRYFLRSDALGVYPAKGVFSVKPGGKKKARAVACGNYLIETFLKDIAASQVDVTGVRGVIRDAAYEDHSTGNIDITAAFLNAPLTDGQIAVLKPPGSCGSWSSEARIAVDSPQSELWAQRESDGLAKASRWVNEKLEDPFNRRRHLEFG